MQGSDDEAIEYLSDIAAATTYARRFDDQNGYFDVFSGNMMMQGSSLTENLIVFMDYYHLNNRLQSQVMKGLRKGLSEMMAEESFQDHMYSFEGLVLGRNLDYARPHHMYDEPWKLVASHTPAEMGLRLDHVEEKSLFLPDRVDLDYFERLRKSTKS